MSPLDEETLPGRFIILFLFTLCLKFNPGPVRFFLSTFPAPLNCIPARSLSGGSMADTSKTEKVQLHAPDLEELRGGKL